MQEYFLKYTPSWIVFSSPSSFQNFKQELENIKKLKKTKIAALGETTAKFIQQQNFDIHWIATEKNLEKLLISIVDQESKKK